jgi:phenylacetate-CoA ligase
MPVIRYRTRDLTRLLPPTARGMRRMDKITGRSDDMLIIRGVNVFPTQIEELICKDSALAPHYELVVSRDGHLDSLAVRVEVNPDTHPSEWDRHAKMLQHSIKSRVGISTAVELVEQGGVARSIGKAKRVRDLRPKA